MEHTCSVIIGSKNGKYIRCGLDATHEALPLNGVESDWKYCPGHAKYYAEANGYPIQRIKEKDNDEKVRGGC